MVDLRAQMRPAPVDGGFALPDYWVWCGSPIRGDDGRYHLFASRWPRSLSFAHWAVCSEIVRASADRPEGPYRFEEVVLPRRGGGFFDGRMTHNPAIVRSGDTFLLFYTGATYEGPDPTPEDPAEQPSARWQQSWHNKRIGLAYAKSVRGPWTRLNRPVLDVRPGAWDSVITSNAAPCVCPDGRVLLLYKSTPDRHDPHDGRFRGRFHLGGAIASSWNQPFERLSDEPLLRFDRPDAHVEDPFCWHDGERFRAIMKDMTGAIGGEPQAGVAAESSDGRTWRLSDPPQAYARKVRWSDGRTTRPAKLERPQLLSQHGKPTHIFFATCDSEVGLDRATRTWVVAIPLADER